MTKRLPDNIKTMIHDLTNAQKKFSDSLTKLNANEDALQYRLDALLDKTAKAVQASTGQSITTTYQPNVTKKPE